MPIFDQGYQHWEGTLAGHAWRWWVITRHGVRTQLKNRWTRMFLLASLLPALGLVVLMALWGLLLQNQDTFGSIFQGMRAFRTLLADPKSYTSVAWTLMYQFYFQVQIYICMILVALVGPTLISQDLRFNALPLYFSRPLTRLDYFAGKLGVIAVFLSMVAILPAVLAYLLGVAFSFDFDILRTTFWILPASILYGSLIVISAGTLILAFSSLSRNSRYVTGMWIGFWVLTGIVSTVLQGIHISKFYREASLESNRRFREREEERMRKMEAGEPAPEQWDRQVYNDPWERAQRRATDAAFTSWRPIVSYQSNLVRMQKAIFQSEGDWNKLATLVNPRDPDRIYKQYSGPNYPWWYSAGILLALFGFSLWVLNRRVKSMDRL